MAFEDSSPAGLLDALIQVESSNNPNAVNKKSGARGLGQITSVALADWNQFNKDKYSMDDMFNPQKNMRVTNWYLMRQIPHYLEHYGLPSTVENVLWAYNAGIGRVRDNVKPQETVEYISKIQNILNAKK